MSFFDVLFTNIFIQSALMAGFLAAFVSGVIGTFVVVKRIVFISGSIAHSVLAGMGLFLWLKRSYGIEWLSPLHGALIAAILSALAIGWIHLHYRQREDALIAALWSTGMAIGVIFISITPGSNIDLIDFLVGNIMWVNSVDLQILALLDLFVLVVVAINYRKFMLICFDEEQSALQDVNVERHYLLLLSLIAISVVLLIQVVGIVLVIAMLALPPTIANLFTNKFSTVMVFAVLLGVAFSFFGIALSFQFDWPPGATIALLSGLTYFAALIWKK